MPIGSLEASEYGLLREWELDTEYLTFSCKQKHNQKKHNQFNFFAHQQAILLQFLALQPAHRQMACRR